LPFNADVEALEKPATPGPPSRRTNDPDRHQCRLRGDEARAASVCPRLLDAQAAETLSLSWVTFAEPMFGIGTLPEGEC